MPSIRRMICLTNLSELLRGGWCQPYVHSAHGQIRNYGCADPLSCTLSAVHSGFLCAGSAVLILDALHLHRIQETSQEFLGNFRPTLTESAQLLWLAQAEHLLGVASLQQAFSALDSIHRTSRSPETIRLPAVGNLCPAELPAPSTQSTAAESLAASGGRQASCSTIGVGGGEGVLMILYAVAIEPLTSHPYETRTEHDGFLPE